jgi:hypothetical protein
MKNHLHHLLILLISLALAGGLVYTRDWYQHPDRIDEQPLLEVDYTDVDDEQPSEEEELQRFFEEELFEKLQNHGAPVSDDTYDSHRERICDYFDDLCDKIYLLGSHSAQQEYFYTALPIYLMYYFDDNIQANKDIEIVIASISIADDPGRRGYANKNTVIINTHDIQSYREFLEIMVHELGHVVDLGVVVGTMKRKDTRYTEFGQAVFALDDPSLDYYQLSRDSESVRKSSQTRDDFCSGYGQRNPFEDFSECMNLYINHHALFVYIAQRSDILQEKYRYIKSLFDGFYLYADQVSVS